MPKNAKVVVPLLLIAIIGSLFAYDALVVSDEEAIEALLETVTGEVGDGWVPRAVALTSPDQHPVEVRALGVSRVYGRGSRPDLEREGARVMSGLTGTSLRVMSQRISVEGDVAQVTLKLMTERGMVDVELRFLRAEGEPRFTVNRVAVDRAQGLF